MSEPNNDRPEPPSAEEPTIPPQGINRFFESRSVVLRIAVALFFLAIAVGMVVHIFQLLTR